MLAKIFNLKPWSLHNPLKGWTLHGLSTREARLLLQTVSLAERRLTSVWRSGWQTWRPLEDQSCVALLRAIPEVAVEAPVVPSHREEEVTDVRISVRPERKDTGREFERHSADVPAEILQGPQSFRTRTVDLSEGGLKFVDVLPEWVAGYFTVILHRSEGNLEITCMLVEDQKNNKTRVEVVETNDEESHLPSYRAWVRGLPKS